MSSSEKEEKKIAHKQMWKIVTKTKNTNVEKCSDFLCAHQRYQTVSMGKSLAAAAVHCSFLTRMLQAARRQRSKKKLTLQSGSCIAYIVPQMAAARCQDDKHRNILVW